MGQLEQQLIESDEIKTNILWTETGEGGREMKKKKQVHEHMWTQPSTMCIVYMHHKYPNSSCNAYFLYLNLIWLEISGGTNNSKYIYSSTVLTNKNSYLNTNSFISVIKHLKYTSVRCITFYYLLLCTHTYILHFLLWNISMATVVTTYFPN